MSEQNKTRPTGRDVQAFLDGIENPTRREDAFALTDLMGRLTGAEPQLWGPSIVGFGEYHYKYDSGREGEFFRTGFSPRKANLVVYIIPGFEPFPDLLERLGKYKTGKSCLYINKLADVDIDVLQELIGQSLRIVEKRYGP